MTNELQQLLKIASRVTMSKPQENQQRISFAYGTAKIENDNVTREMVERALEKSNR